MPQFALPIPKYPLLSISLYQIPSLFATNQCFLLVNLDLHPFVSSFSRFRHLGKTCRYEGMEIALTPQM